jgi:hypothetical protein
MKSPEIKFFSNKALPMALPTLSAARPETLGGVFHRITYRAGRSPHWIKVKNRKHPAMYRVMDAIG